MITSFKLFFLIGIPLGLLTTNILFINQYPDFKSDKKSGKINLVVLFGKKMSRWIYFSNLILILISTYYFFNSFSKSSNNFNIHGLYIILSLLTVYGFYIFRGLFKYFDSRELVNYNIQTIYYQIVFCLAIILVFYLWFYVFKTGHAKHKSVLEIFTWFIHCYNIFNYWSITTFIFFNSWNHFPGWRRSYGCS